MKDFFGFSRSIPFTERERAELGDCIDQYKLLVYQIVGQYMRSLPYDVDVDELQSAAFDGLIDAWEKFDHSLGFKFKTYATPRIRGAIIDYLRYVDPLSKQYRMRAKQIEKEWSLLAHQLGRKPTREEWALACNMSVERFEEVLCKTKNQISSLNILCDDDEEEKESSLLNILSDPNVINPIDEEDRQIVEQDVWEVIGSLPEMSAVVIVLYYYLGHTMKEIGNAIGVTESRISQIHRASIFSLRRKLKDKGYGLASPCQKTQTAGLK